MMNITIWTNKASSAVNAANNAKASAETKKSLFNELAFGALQILLSGKIQDEIALAGMVSKNGPYQALRQCVSNARGLLPVITLMGSIIISKKGEEPRTINKAAILDAELPLFSVATEYKKHRPEKDSSDMSDKKLIELALEAEGSSLTYADVAKLSQPAQDAYIEQGRALHNAATEQANNPVLQALASYQALTTAQQGEFIAMLQEVTAQVA